MFEAQQKIAQASWLTSFSVELGTKNGWSRLDCTTVGIKAYVDANHVQISKCAWPAQPYDGQYATDARRIKQICA